MSCPQPTPQYGQIDRATCASSIRACIARVLSDIASNPVPSDRSRIWRMTGHFESNAVSDVMSFIPRLSSQFHCYRLVARGNAQKRGTTIIERFGFLRLPIDPTDEVDACVFPGRQPNHRAGTA